MRICLLLFLALACGRFSSVAEEKGPAQSPADAPEETEKDEAGPAIKLTPEAEAALAKLKMPGVDLNLEERSVDVEATVCLHEGLLELVACTKGTKEHESIVAIDARPRHVHTALLLLGAKSGNPAMRRQIGEPGDERWVDIPPRGGDVRVFFVYKGKDGKTVERPISDFISPADKDLPGFVGEEVDEDDEFPTHTFLFAGSMLHGEGEGPRTYLSDVSGNVITIATFGDEMLCLPGIHSHEKGALMWQVDPAHDLPAVGEKVLLRLRPGK